MEIKFLGTGGAFDWQKGTSSAIINVEGKNILIDCGFSVLQTLAEKNLMQSIDYVLVTHLHGDHIGGLPTFLAYTGVRLEKQIPIIVPSGSFRDELSKFFVLTFETKRANYVSIDEFPQIGFIDTFGQHVPDMPTHAYYFTDGDELIYYSGDLGKVDTTLDFLKTRTEKNIRVFHDINPQEGKGGHVYYKDAVEKLKDYDVYGFHCDKDTMPEDNTIKLVEDYPELNY